MLKRAPNHQAVRNTRPERKLKKVQINTASASAIHELPDITQADVMEILRRRPFKSWENVQTALNWEPEFVERLQKAGARIDGQ